VVVDAGARRAAGQHVVEAVALGAGHGAVARVREAAALRIGRQRRGAIGARPAAGRRDVDGQRQPRGRDQAAGRRPRPLAHHQRPHAVEGTQPDHAAATSAASQDRQSGPQCRSDKCIAVLFNREDAKSAK
jgi:hypothetical protein